MFDLEFDFGLGERVDELRGAVREFAQRRIAPRAATIDRDNPVILVRFQQKVYACALAYPHENTALRWRS